MSTYKVKRRDFLKITGLTGASAALAACDMPTTVTLEEGEEEVVSYLMPEEYVIPGIGVWYASTCQQCDAGCGIIGRVREGRVLKLEGNPVSPINKGALCQIGQAALQVHYNPDRLKQPKLRQEGKLIDVTWDDAFAALKSSIGPDSGLDGSRIAWLTGTVSGHQRVLMDAVSEAVGGASHYAHETLNDTVVDKVNADVYGSANVQYKIADAQSILSFGADFLSTWGSPVHNSVQYGQFRDAPRGVLIQAEPKMTVTGGSADLWLPVRPGTEGTLAMTIAAELVASHGADATKLPKAMADQLGQYSLDSSEAQTGVAASLVKQAANFLATRAPSLVIAGGTAAAHEHGYEAVTAAAMLNVLLGNVGKTIIPVADFPYPALAPKKGDTAQLAAFAKKAKAGDISVALIAGTNPAYTAPDQLDMAAALSAVKVKVAFTEFLDETSSMADIVLPLHSDMESWGTHVASYQVADPMISLQQPLMEPLYAETRSLGDTLLDVLKLYNAEQYGPFADYYAYLRNVVSAVPAVAKEGASDEAYWQAGLQQGMLKVTAPKPFPAAIATAANDDASDALVKSADTMGFVLPVYEKNKDYPLSLIPAASSRLGDGRFANLPWLQEAPDAITKIVWNSWVEMHPATALYYGFKQGDFVEVASAEGSVKAQIYLHKGINKDAVAVPMGQGHTEYGRYATGRGVNPLKMLATTSDVQTGELALCATRVTVVSTGRNEELVKMGGSESQVGRKLVGTITADQLRRV
ncbi:MAG: molybdopterin dinucleotide-binding protein [Gammaproteobacteria bacterium]|nr:molybdopterin-dependent oxidoreductase [Gammaproteobacteria bacterium]PCH64664.1 MAG: molybdopterin dinucleotide-binding protein [Gammaproteobacteria bacterium]